MEYGNLAYQYDNMPNKKKKPQQSRKQTKVQQSQKKRQINQNRKRTIKTAAAILTVALSAGYMISQFVLVKETEQSLAEYNKQLSDVQAYISQKVFELEQSVDLQNIEEEATTRLNMQRPEKYQTIYVDVKQDDVTEVTASAVEGVTKRFKSIMEKIGKHIVDTFSIK